MEKTERTIKDGKLVALQCPVCNRSRHPNAFRGNTAEEHGWFGKCSSCRDAHDKVEDCGACSGTGRYTPYSVHHGTYVDRGECYRCKGKGWITQSDVNRNGSYDSWSAAQAMHGDMHTTPEEETTLDDNSHEEAVANLKEMVEQNLLDS